MMKVEIVIHENLMDDDDVEYYLGQLRYATKYADGVGNFTVTLVEDVRD